MIFKQIEVGNMQNFCYIAADEESKEAAIIDAGFDPELLVEEAKKLGFDDLLYYTWTCWYPVDGKPCNKCKTCSERIIECRSIGDTI